MDGLVSFTLSDAEFSSLKTLVFEHTGINLGDAKRELVKRRFAPRLKALGLPKFNDYVEYVRDNQAQELAHFCNAITTNLTSFFREHHHFELLADRILPEACARKAGSLKRLRLWSAGCSSGQEAYCLAMVLRKAVPQLDTWDAKILATDLDENCLATARRGEYPESGFDKAPAHFLKDYFRPLGTAASGSGVAMLGADDALKRLIAFKKLNLMQESWPMRGKFDVIFCRNVFIYFTKETQAQLVAKYADLQEPGSYLCLGHSEVISNPMELGYRLIGKTTYIRI